MVLALTLTLVLVLTLALAPSGMISKKGVPEFCPSTVGDCGDCSASDVLTTLLSLSTAVLSKPVEQSEAAVSSLSLLDISSCLQVPQPKTAMKNGVFGVIMLETL